MAGDIRDGLLARRAWLGIALASALVVGGHAITFLIAARTAGVTASPSQMLPIALLVMMAMVLPSVGGWGPREGVTAWAFGAAGLGAQRGVTTAVVYGVMVLVATLPGAAVLVVAWFRRTRRRDGPNRRFGRELPMPERPYTLLSCGMSIDGYLGSAAPRRLELSNDADFDRVDAVRASCDAILVGAATVRNDNPRLLVRSQTRRDERTARGLAPSPIKVTVTERVELDAVRGLLHHRRDREARLLRESAGASMPARDSGRWRRSSTAAQPVQMRRISEDLGDRGVRRLMVEGGGKVHTQFLTDNLADELQLVVAPFFVGDSRAPRFVSDGRFPWNPGRRATLAGVRQIGDVVLLRYALSPRFQTDSPDGLRQGRTSRSAWSTVTASCPARRLRQTPARVDARSRRPTRACCSHAAPTHPVNHVRRQFGLPASSRQGLGRTRTSAPSRPNSSTASATASGPSRRPRVRRAALVGVKRGGDDGGPVDPPASARRDRRRTGSAGSDTRRRRRRRPARPARPR